MKYKFKLQLNWIQLYFSVPTFLTKCMFGD